MVGSEIIFLDTLSKSFCLCIRYLGHRLCQYTHSSRNHILEPLGLCIRQAHGKEPRHRVNRQRALRIRRIIHRRLTRRPCNGCRRSGRVEGDVRACGVSPLAAAVAEDGRLPVCLVCTGAGFQDDHHLVWVDQWSGIDSVPSGQFSNNSPEKKTIMAG